VNAHLHEEIDVVVETVGLTRRFGALAALDDVGLTLPAGGVVGLVGPNGSGKSTLIRILLGLLRATEGAASVFGEPVSAPQAYAARVGALIENPAFVPGLSARTNLISLARLRGLPPTRVEEVMEVVGLVGRGREPVKQFSLGMKQRLGIAAALLGDPELLVLDEPTNGLDPAGIVEIRRLLHSLSQAGRTVVVSSHLLSEIESVCSYLVVIRFGVLIYAGPMADLLDQTDSRVEVQPELSSDRQRLQLVLTDAGWQVNPGLDDGLQVTGARRSVSDAETGGGVGRSTAAEINRVAAAAGITLAGLSISRASLESVFLEMTGDDVHLAADRADASGKSVLR